MRALIRVALILCGMWPLAAAAQEVELMVFGAMVEGPDGAPLATATVLSNDGMVSLYVTSTGAAQAQGACVRTWQKGDCHPLEPGQTGALPGIAGLSVVGVRVPNDETMAKFTEMQINMQPRTGVLDPAADGRQLGLLTQTGFGGWLIPLDPAQVTGMAANGVTIAGEALTGLSVGAPVVHAEKGLIGVVAQAGAGGALVAGVVELFDAMVAAGYPVPEQMRPQGATGELPRAVANGLGRVLVFEDYRDIGQGLAGFYGPSQGVGFDEAFVTELEFSSWEIRNDGTGRELARNATMQPLVPNGMPISAAYGGPAPDLAASCIVHATPASQGRRALVIQFWRAVPERFNPNTGSKSYDQAAAPLTGWADGPTPCADRLGRLDEARMAALRGQAPPAGQGEAAAPQAAPQPTEPSGQPPAGGGWSSVAGWGPTGRVATGVALADGRTLTLGCTESRELLVAIGPGQGVAGLLIGGRPAYEEGQAQGMAYGYFPRAALQQLASGASIGFRLGGQAFDLPGPSDLDAVMGNCRD